MVKVSLIVPVYNTAKYLEKCLNSILSQTLKEIEVIIINDGSPDKADEIVKKYTDDRIVYIEKNNEGIGKTRNLGIGQAKGEFLAFVDSDDYLGSNFCEVLYNKAKIFNCDVVVCDYYEDRENFIEVRIPPFKDSNLDEMPSIIENINLGPCNKLYERSLLIKEKILFEEKLKYEDAPFVVKTLLKAKRIGKVNDCLTHYVIHENSETTVRDARIFDILDITEIIIDEMGERDNLSLQTVNIAVMILTDYTIQQKYISGRKERSRFIDEAFDILDRLNKNWRKSSYLDKFSSYKRVIKTNRLLTKIYCSLYHYLKCR